MQIELFPNKDLILLKEKFIQIRIDLDMFITEYSRRQENIQETCLEDRLKIHLLKKNIIKELESFKT